MSHDYLLFLASTATKTVIVLVYLVVALRLLGKREVGQMNIYDLAMIMAVANAVQNAMTRGNGNLTAGMTSAGTLILLGWIITRIFIRLPNLEKRVIGSPAVLINDGQIVELHMHREHVTEQQLMMVLRTHSLTSPDQVDMAILEVDGSISVVPKPEREKKRHKAK